MSNKLFVLVALAALSFVGYMGLAQAHMLGKGAGAETALHDELEQVMDSGAYEDLVALREKYEANFMPWVQDTEDFVLAKDLHERMEEYHGKTGHGLMGGFGMHAGCPMLAGA